MKLETYPDREFLMLGLALERAALDRALAWAELWPVKLAEWGLVVLLVLHLLFGARLLVLAAKAHMDKGAPAPARKGPRPDHRAARVTEAAVNVYGWLTGRGSITILNNGIEFAGFQGRLTRKQEEPEPAPEEPDAPFTGPRYPIDEDGGGA